MDIIAPFVAYTAGKICKADLIRMVKTLRHEQLAARQTAERNAKHAQYLQHGDQGLPNPNMRMPAPAAPYPNPRQAPPAHVTNRMSPGELRLSDFATDYATNPDILGTGE